VAEVIWTDEAISDLKAIGNYFGQTSPEYASVVVGKLYDSAERLTEHPRIGRKVPEVDHASLRELLVEGYRVVYQLREEHIEIITVLHSRQDLGKKFRGR